MLSFWLSKNILRGIAAVFVFALIGCQSDETAFQSDEQAKRDLNTVAQKLSIGSNVTNKELAALKTTYEKYPTSQTLRKTYQTILIKRQDWETLRPVLERIPEAERSDDDWKNLGKTLYKLGRYKDAIGHLRRFEEGNDLDARSVSANAYFKLGDYEQAGNLLDSRWKEIEGKKRYSDIALRGVIHFHEEENDKALKVLNSVIDADPKNITALNTLARLHGRLGNEEKASEYLSVVDRAFEEITANEKRAANLVGKVNELQRAYRERRYDDTIKLIKEVLPQLDKQKQAVLYTYLINSYQALGDQVNATKAKQELSRLQNQ